jgi:hypothetical protein
MSYPTYQDLREAVERELDLEEETFIQPQEMLKYCNDALREAEKQITTMYEDYFLSKTYLPLVVGVSEYDLPLDIWAHKIRGIVYQSGTIIYQIKRLRTKNMFEDIEEINQFSTSDWYRYFILKQGADPKLVLTPPAKETSTQNVKIYYLREVKKVAQDTDTIDIPEATNFIVSYMKSKCGQKENSGLPVAELVEDTKREMETFIETLREMVPDKDNSIEQDFSTYEEHS